MTTILLIRHGESEANRENIFAGYLNVDLLENGRVQAKLTAQYIKENYRVDKIYSSDLKRALNTAKALADIFGLEVEATPQLREIDAGKWDGIKYDKLIEMYKEDFSGWIHDFANSRCTGGESVKELSVRVIKELTRIAEENDGKTVAVATHATPIRAMQTIIQYGDVSEIGKTGWVSNASVTELKYDAGKWECIEISHDEHLGNLGTRLPDSI